MNNEVINFSKEDIFSLSSLAFIEDYADKDLDIEWLENIISTILQRRFAHPLKRIINSFSNRITFSCPYCGDSEDDINKKRGNIFFDSLKFHCFNCGYHTSAYNLIKLYSEDITQGELLFLKSFKTSNNSYRNTFSDVLNRNLIDKYTLEKSDVFEHFKLSRIEGTVGEKYLSQRYQIDLSKFAYDSKSNAIVIFNQDENKKIIGFAKRLLNKGINNRYLSYKISSIYETMKMVPEDSLEYIDRISMVFNVLELDFNRTITVFEGPFDAFLYNNSVATSGLTKELPFDGENIRYWLDNDQPGLEKSKEYLQNDKQVFLWNKYLRDMRIPTYKHIKDLTDLITYAKHNNLKLKEFDPYFSNNRIDLFFL